MKLTRMTTEICTVEELQGDRINKSIQMLEFYGWEILDVKFIPAGVTVIVNIIAQKERQEAFYFSTVNPMKDPEIGNTLKGITKTIIEKGGDMLIHKIFR